ncbi:MAG TPA: RtcB family protein [Thermoanaerobaculia bacterium]|jgi:tRNA-splicing ligase RtcB|nr:RtcB family protein [Thermoanaerobaculia bacterium]
MGRRRSLDAVRRVDATHLLIANPQRVPVTLFASSEIPIEPEAIAELLAFVSLQETLDTLAGQERAGRIAPFWGDGGREAGRLARLVVTPDFHRGSGIPIGTVADARGFVIPKAVGTDICCGMRLLVTDLTRQEIEPRLHLLAAPLRARFFEGRRDIPMSPRQRESLLRDGLRGLLATCGDNAGSGIWRQYDPRAQEADLARVHFGGSLPAQGTFTFADYIRGSGSNASRDSHLGSVGGGNHFVEIQIVEEVLDGALAREWGLRQGTVAIMAHSGSVGLGHAVGGHFADRARAIFPREIRRPAHGFDVLPVAGPHARLAAEYLDAMRNAANFAFGNRLMLGLMAAGALSEVAGRRVDTRLVYDAPHNLIWEPTADSPGYLHRKGACPALGPEPATESPFRYSGHPVIIPGSMGSASYVMAGTGSEEALASACHGAGRALTRTKARQMDAATYTRTVAPLRVVTPIDPTAATVRGRHDILEQHHGRLKEEAPSAYKAIAPVIETIEQAGIARPVARLWPLLTIKG